MARSLCFLNLKGGVGKTSLAVNIAAHLAYHKGKRTLLVDMDPQSNASQWLLKYRLWKKIDENPEHSVYAIFLNNGRNVGQNLIQAPVKKGDGQVIISNLDVLPASYRLMDLEHEFQETPGVPYFQQFRNHIEIFFPHYEYVNFDCPPNLYRGTTCALSACTEIYVPCNPDRLSYAGLWYLSKKLKEKRSLFGADNADQPMRPFAQMRGIIMNDGNPKASYKEIYEEYELKLAEIRNLMPEIVHPEFCIIQPMVRSYEDARKSAYLEKPVTIGNTTLAQDYAEIAGYIDSRE